MLGVEVKIFSDELPGGKGKKPLPEPRSVDVNPCPVDPVAPPPEQQGFDQAGYQQGGFPQGDYQQEAYQ